MFLSGGAAADREHVLHVGREQALAQHALPHHPGRAVDDRPHDAYSSASFANFIHIALRATPTASHSFIRRPWPGSKRSPTRAALSSSTRSAGSFTTSRPFE